MKRLLGRFYVTGSFWYRFHLWGVSVLPNWGVRVFITLFTTFFFVALRRIRKAIAKNLEVVLGPCGWWERQKRIYRTMWNLAWCLSERYERLSGRRETCLTITGEEIWRRKLASPEGFVIATAHIGAWETALFNPAAGKERMIHVVREEEMDEEGQDLMRRLVQNAAGEHVKMHFVRADDARLAGELLIALRKGGVVAVQGDRPRSGGRSVTAKLFDRELEIPMGPAALARAAGVEIVPLFCFRRGRMDVEVVVREPIRPSRSGDRAGDLEVVVQRLATEIEWAIRRSPFQWFCFRDLWSGARRPPSARRRARAAVVTIALLSLLAGACAALRRPVAPMPMLSYSNTEPERADKLVVLLPGRRSRPEAFDRYGVVGTILEAHPRTTVVAVDSHLGYYRAGTIRDRLREDVLEPARGRYSEVWLVGTSLGGIGALSMAAKYPDEITGAVLLAPYLGPKKLIDEIAAAGGAGAWQPSDDEDVLADVWRRIRDQSEIGDGPRLYLGFGREDRLADANRLLAELLPQEWVVELPGGHRWSVWIELLDSLIDRGALDARLE